MTSEQTQPKKKLTDGQIMILLHYLLIRWQSFRFLTPPMLGLFLCV
jgi:hypothetical protein